MMATRTYQYFIKSLGETIDDAVEIKSNLDVPEYAAELAAKESWNERDGSDWMPNDCVITMCYGGEVIGNYKIEVVVEPSFYATKVGDGK
jgi:hypothetical protein